MIPDASSVVGAVLGLPITATDSEAVWWTYQDQCQLTMLTIRLSNVGGICSRFSTDESRGEVYLDVDILQDPYQRTIPPGTYPVRSFGQIDACTTPIVARVALSAADAQCDSIAYQYEATSGTVTLDDEASASGVAGTFAVQFPDGSLRGTFAAPACPGPVLPPQGGAGDCGPPAGQIMVDAGGGG